MKRLNQFRIDAGYSIADIASAAGVDESTACRWLSGTAEPDEEQAAKLASIFGIDPHDFDEPEPTETGRRFDRLRSRFAAPGRLTLAR